MVFAAASKPLSDGARGVSPAGRMGRPEGGLDTSAHAYFSNATFTRTILGQ